MKPPKDYEEIHRTFVREFWSQLQYKRLARIFEIWWGWWKC